MNIYKGGKGVGGGERGGKEKQTNWRPWIKLGTSALENRRKCHKNNSNDNKVTLRPCELLQLAGKKREKGIGEMGKTKWKNKGEK